MKLNATHLTNINAYAYASLSGDWLAITKWFVWRQKASQMLPHTAQSFLIYLCMFWPIIINSNKGTYKARTLTKIKRKGIACCTRLLALRLIKIKKSRCTQFTVACNHSLMHNQWMVLTPQSFFFFILLIRDWTLFTQKCASCDPGLKENL